jgi:uroporphyrinogen-III decarboxylase
MPGSEAHPPVMNGRERLMRVMHQQPVDRIPVAPFIHVNYVKEFFGTHEVDWVARTPEVYRHFGFDVMHRNCTPKYDPYGPSARDWEVEAAVEQDGRDETRTTVIHTPKGDLRAVEALRWTCEYDAEESPIEYLVKTERDLDLMLEFQPPPGPADTDDVRRAVVAVGDEGIAGPWIFGAFAGVAYLFRKLDDLLMDPLLRPDFYARLMTYSLERYMKFATQVLDAGPDFVSYGGNIANAKTVGPDFFRQHVFPYERRFIEFIQERGVPVLYHNCGYGRKLLPLYPRLGMRAYESLTPPPYGNTVLSEAVEIFACTTTLIGNLDQIDLLRSGTSGEIDAAVRQVVETVRGRSHFILGTTDYFNENTPHANIHAMADAGLRYGKM